MEKGDIPKSRRGIILGREFLTLALILFVLLGLFWVASIGKLPNPTGNVVLNSAFTCISNTNGAYVYDSAYTLYYAKTNSCVDSSKIKKYSCLSSTASNWWNSLFMTTSNNVVCPYGCANNVCNNPPPTNPPPSCTDADGDLYGLNCAKGNDCNDNNNQVNPGASEVCTDNLDNNCNGIVNENCPVCGNGILEGSEQCDNADVGGTSCSSLGFYGGTLKCTSSCTFDTSSCISNPGAQLPVVPDRKPTLMGFEYATEDNSNPFATNLIKTGGKAIKLYPESFTMWHKHQPYQNQTFSLAKLDAQILEYQKAGFKNFTMGMRSASEWASIDVGDLDSPLPAAKNPLPKAEFVAAHDAWLKAVVERYDGDGVSDMPGLLYPIHLYEVGVEFSSYEAEPVDQYVAHLDRVYTLIHQADSKAVVAHAAFLTVGAFDADPNPASIENAFKNIPDNSHSLADMRKVLDHPQSFDVVNIHSLGDPREIDGIVKWLNAEMTARNYKKDIIISDTAITPFIAFGFANTCNNLLQGKMFYPAVETDRCRTAEYFKQLINETQYPDTVKWAHGYVASDMVKRYVIAADNNIRLINLGFIEDLFLFKGAFGAGSGNSAWGGIFALNIFRNGIQEYRAAYYAVKQLNDRLGGYNKFGRVDVDNENARVYLAMVNNKPVWVAWYHPTKLILPGDAVPELKVSLPVVNATTMEYVITKDGQTTPTKTSLSVVNGYAEVTLTPTPVYIY